MICIEPYVEPGAFPALETAPAPTKTQVWHGIDWHRFWRLSENSESHWSGLVKTLADEANVIGVPGFPNGSAAVLPGRQSLRSAGTQTRCFLDIGE